MRRNSLFLSGLHEIPLIGADIRQRRNTDLRLVAMPRVVSGWLAPATAEFRKLHPGIRINIDVQRRHDMENCLAGRRYEFGVGTLPAQHAAIDTVMIFRAPMGAVVARNHPLARCKRIAASDLLDHTLIGMSPGLLPREQMDAILGTVAAKPPYDIETSATYLARKLAAQGAGVTLIDTISAAVTDRRTVVVPLEPRAWVTFGLLKPK